MEQKIYNMEIEYQKKCAEKNYFESLYLKTSSRKHHPKMPSLKQLNAHIAHVIKCTWDECVRHTPPTIIQEYSVISQLKPLEDDTELVFISLLEEKEHTIQKLKREIANVYSDINTIEQNLLNSLYLLDNETSNTINNLEDRVKMALELQKSDDGTITDRLKIAIEHIRRKECITH